MKNYFSNDELACPCCGQLQFKDETRRKLNIARAYTGIPFVITSGYRCEQHNASVGGVSNSSHTKGHAVDIAAASATKRLKIVSGLIYAGFNRIGISKNFIHVDDDPSKPSQVMWTY